MIEKVDYTKYKLPEDLQNIYEISFYKPSSMILTRLKEHKPIELSMLLKDMDAFIVHFNTYKKILITDDKSCEDLVVLILKCARYYIEHEKDNIRVTYHAAWRFVKRYSNEYDLNKVLSKANKDHNKTACMEFIADIFRRVMYDDLNRIVKNGRTPYKFKKKSEEFAQYLEYKKHKYGDNTVLKVYKDAIFIFARNQKIFTLITMFDVPDEYKQFLSSNEKIKSFYDTLAEKNMIGLPLIAGCDSPMDFSITFDIREKTIQTGQIHNG